MVLYPTSLSPRRLTEAAVVKLEKPNKPVISFVWQCDQFRRSLPFRLLLRMISILLFGPLALYIWSKSEDKIKLQKWSEVLSIFWAKFVKIGQLFPGNIRSHRRSGENGFLITRVFNFLRFDTPCLFWGNT